MNEYEIRDKAIDRVKARFKKSLEEPWITGIKYMFVVGLVLAVFTGITGYDGDRSHWGQVATMIMAFCVGWFVGKENHKEFSLLVDREVSSIKVEKINSKIAS